MADNRAFSSSSVICHLSSADASQTQAIAAALARQCRRGDCILLHGDLGAGKTTFARGFIQSLQSAPDEVTSPTFTLVQTYPTRDGVLWHFDLYRLEHAGEALELGLDEALPGGITLIEWPQRVQSQLPEDALTVTLAIAGPGHRLLSFAGLPPWRARLEAMKESV